MAISTGYYFLCYIYVMMVAEEINSSDFGITIGAKAFDSSGLETHMLFDGGTVQITCWYVDNGTEPLELHIATDTKHDKFAKFDVGNDTLVQHRLPINLAALLKAYKCRGGKEESPKIQIGYVLCKRSIKPIKVCPKPKELCQITQTGSAECKILSKRSCVYGYDPDDFATQHQMQLLPKFSFVCQKYGPLFSLRMGFCYSHTTHEQHPMLLGVTHWICVYAEFNLYICENGCKTKRNLTMDGWNFRDLAYPFSIYADASYVREKVMRELICSVGVHGSPTKMFTIVQLGDKRLNLSSMAQQLIQLSTPTLADIICTASKNNASLYQFQTNLLLFKSNADLKYEITHRIVAPTDGYVIFWVTIEATAANGLYVCISRRNTQCVPSNESTSHRIRSSVSVKQGQRRNHTITFHVRLFASSPKVQYVLLYEGIVDRTVVLSGASLPRNKISSAAPEAKDGTKGTAWKIGFTVTLVVATVSIGAMVVITVKVVRKKNATGQQYQEDIPARVPEPKPLAKKLKTSLEASRTEFITLRKSSIQD